MYIFCACMHITMHTLHKYRYVLIHTNAGDPYQWALMVGRDVRLVESAPSKFGGLGLMASRNFEAGDVILVETPFLSVQVFPRLSDEYPSIQLSAGSRSILHSLSSPLALLLSLSRSLALALSPSLARALSRSLSLALFRSFSLSLFIDLSIHLSVYLSIYLSVFLCTHIRIHVHIHIYICIINIHIHHHYMPD